jgi:hypothetical protein
MGGGAFGASASTAFSTPTTSGREAGVISVAATAADVAANTANATAHFEIFACMIFSCYVVDYGCDWLLDLPQDWL